MAIFSPRIHVFVKSDVNTIWETENTIQVEAPSFDGLLSDLDQICKEVFAAIVQHYVDLNWQTFPLEITVRYLVFSLEKEFHKRFVWDELEELKKQRQPDRPKLNEASLVNDIQYGITMIRSIVDIKKDVAMHGVVSWYYHLLLKHFGLIIPTEIMEIHESNMRKLHGKEEPK